MVELDVGWTGDLVGALMTTYSSSGGGGGGGSSSDLVGGHPENTTASSSSSSSGGSSEASMREPDWVAYNTMRADAGWRWFSVRNWDTGNTSTEVWRSYRHAARYSRRLLRAIAAHMAAGRVQSDEATAASVCKSSPDWCVVDASWQPGHPVNGQDGRTGEALYRWELMISPERWAAIVANDEGEAQRCAAAAAAAGEAAGEAVAAGWKSGGGAREVAAASDLNCMPGRLYHKLKW